MNPEHLHILQHSLGCDEHGQTTHRLRDEDDGCFGYYRNRYVADPNPDLEALCRAGWMEDRGAHEIADGMHYYRVTKAGLAEMLFHSPKPPALTAGQRRYREYLDADCGMSFIEYLKWRHANRHDIEAFHRSQ